MTGDRITTHDGVVSYRDPITLRIFRGPTAKDDQEQFTAALAAKQGPDLTMSERRDLAR